MGLPIDEMRRLRKFLIEEVEGSTCPYCGLFPYINGWVEGHSPIIRIRGNVVELGYYCYKSGQEVILYTIDRDRINRIRTGTRVWSDDEEE